MHLEIHDVKVHSNKLVFKLEYDEEFRQEVGRIQNKTLPSKRDIQNYILDVIENGLDDENLRQLGD